MFNGAVRGSNCVALPWRCLARLALHWRGLVCLALACLSLLWFGLAWLCLARRGLACLAFGQPRLDGRAASAKRSDAAGQRTHRFIAFTVASLNTRLAGF